MPFEIVMAKSQFSNTENIETETQLADSGYGQGQILINPLHMACIYTAFCNEGNVIKPRLLYSQETKPEYWIPNAFSVAHTNIVLEGLKKVVNDSHGTSASTERIAEILSDIYEEAVHTNTLGSLDMMRRMVARLGENNLFLCNWSENDFGDLDFYDLFDRFYPMMPSQNGTTTLYVDESGLITIRIIFSQIRLQSSHFRMGHSGIFLI